MMKFINRFLKDKTGATAIEYGLIAAIVGVGIIASLGPLKESLNSTFNKAGDKMKEAVGN